MLDTGGEWEQIKRSTPVADHHQHIRNIDDAVAVYVGGAGADTHSPRIDDHEQVNDVDQPVAVGIAGGAIGATAVASEADGHSIDASLGHRVIRVVGHHELELHLAG